MKVLLIGKCLFMKRDAFGKPGEEWHTLTYQVFANNGMYGFALEELTVFGPAKGMQPSEEPMFRKAMESGMDVEVFLDITPRKVKEGAAPDLSARILGVTLKEAMPGPKLPAVATATQAPK